MANQANSIKHSCAALIIAPLVAAYAAAIFVLWLQPVGWSVLEVSFLFAVFGAYPAAVVLAVPALFLLRGRIRATALVCGLLGGSIGIVVFFVWTRIAQFKFGTVEVGIVALAGAFGGLTFWLIARNELNAPAPPVKQDRFG